VLLQNGKTEVNSLSTGRCPAIFAGLTAVGQQDTQATARWTPSMQLLRRVLMTTLVDSGQELRPFSDGPLVRACDIELVRAEFYRQYPADGTEQQKADARRKAFGRTVKESVARSLVTTREVDGVQLIWLNELGPVNG
jgi:hypothetical protein